MLIIAAAYNVFARVGKKGSAAKGLEELRADIAFALSGSKSAAPVPEDLSYRCVVDLCVANGICTRAGIRSDRKSKSDLLAALGIRDDVVAERASSTGGDLEEEVGAVIRDIGRADIGVAKVTRGPLKLAMLRGADAARVREEAVFGPRPPIADAENVGAPNTGDRQIFLEGLRKVDLVAIAGAYDVCERARGKAKKGRAEFISDISIAIGGGGSSGY